MVCCQTNGCNAPIVTPPQPASCAAPSNQTCCTRILSDPSAVLSVRLQSPSALTSITVWGKGGGLISAAAVFGGAHVSISSGGTSTGCMVADGIAAGKLPIAPAGFAAAALVCGARGDRVQVALPGALSPPASPGAHLALRICTATAGDGMRPAALWVQQA